MTLSEKRKREALDLLNDPAWLKSALDSAKHKQENPYEHSQLRYWLSLDKWAFGEGLLILAGVEPGTVESDESPFLLEEATDRSPWKNAALFSQTEAFFHFDYDPFAPLGDDLRQELEAQSEVKREVIGRHWATFASLKHRASRTLQPFGDSLEPGERVYPPSAFLGWAERIGFRPDWLHWATEAKCLPESVSVMQAPFFDADAPDYPELLAIAVRAWEHARSSAGGTPKQRVHEYLAQRYEHIPMGTREAIATVVNWRRTGGRPASSEETGG